MSKVLEFTAWNIHDGINDPAVQQELINGEPDIAALPEAYGEAEGLYADTVRAFGNAGYALFHRPYNDDDGRKDRHGLAIVAKPEHVQQVRVARLASRTALLMTIAGTQGAQALAYHGDDRSAERRYAMYLAAHARVVGETVIALGDFNDMYPDAPHANLLRRAGPWVQRLPSRDPVPGEKTPKLHRLGSLSQRTAQMAFGHTVGAFAQDGYRDAAEGANPHAVTFKKGPLGVGLDRILYRGKAVVVRPTEVSDGQNLSDHKKVSARLRVG